MFMINSLTPKNYTSRKPYQVLVIPYFINRDDEISYALFQRSDDSIWQAIAGGGDLVDKTILDTAKREAHEETGISNNSKFMQLSTISSIPVTAISGFIWGKDTLVIPEYTFAVLVKDQQLHIGHEHKTYSWFSYAKAMKLLKWDSNKTALWELDHRLNHS